MKINKDGISEEDKELAVGVLNNLRNQNRVIGNPAEGLKITLREIEEKRDSVQLTKLQWGLRDKETEETIAKLKAGIEGEELLSEFLTQLLTYNDALDGIIAFASMSQDQQLNDKEYIPDSDFVLVNKDNYLIVDAKNISTSPNVPIVLEGGNIISISNPEKPKMILEGIHSSIRVWKKYFDDNGISYNSIKNLVCIVNKTGANVVGSRNTEMELIHIADLNDYLTNWYQLPSNHDFVKLYDLTQLAKCQIRKEKSDLDLSTMKKMFKL